MDDSFELLEQRVRKAAELVRGLRERNRALERDVGEAKTGLKDAQKRLGALEKQRQSTSARTKEHESLKREVETLLQEREEVRDRIGKLVKVLDELE